MQRQRVLSFLRAKITGAPWEEELWQINPVQMVIEEDTENFKLRLGEGIY